MYVRKTNEGNQVYCKNCVANVRGVCKDFDLPLCKAILKCRAYLK